jgi:hypothetical protein
MRFKVNLEVGWTDELEYHAEFWRENPFETSKKNR